MSRPKDGNKRCIILDLSYPKGNSWNDHVIRKQFDNSIRNTESFPVLFKVNVARAFRNLRVDPADGLKFGNKGRIPIIWIQR